jgi:hypothetical protein
VNSGDKKCSLTPIFLSQVKAQFPKYFDELDKIGELDKIWNNKNQEPTPNHTQSSSNPSQQISA